MTIIDTTLYCNGELRLARHGAGRGGNVLVHVPSGDAIALCDEQETIAVTEIINHYETRPTAGSFTSEYIFLSLQKYHEGFAASYRS
jgi:hypothetical protein